MVAAPAARPGRSGSAHGAGVRGGVGWREEGSSEAAEVEVTGWTEGLH